jgi:hypothetical protein
MTDFLELSNTGLGMVSSGLLRRVAIVRTDVSEAPGSSETSVLTRATRRNNPEDTILHSHCRETLKSYNTGLVCTSNCFLNYNTWQAFKTSHSTPPLQRLSGGSKKCRKRIYGIR